MDDDSSVTIEDRVNGAWRANLENQIVETELKLRQLGIEHRSKTALLNAISEKRLRAARFSGIRNDRNQVLDIASMTKNNLSAALAEIENEQQEKEGLLAVLREEYTICIAEKREVPAEGDSQCQ